LKLQEAKAILSKDTMEKLSPDEIRKTKISAVKDLFIVDESSDRGE